MKQPLYLPDLGNGTYQNPIILCDYSDPDVIRVGDTYYLTASSFNYVPGLPILVSKDLVNWELKNYALKNIPEERYQTPRHAQGVWAPAIRYHEGRFYIYYGMPDEGIYMVSAEDALGKWDEPVCVLPGKGLIDPCPYWDEETHLAYVVHGYARSRIGIKSHLGVFPMNWEGTKATGDDHIIYNGLATQPTIEGPKVYKRGEYVYIFAPAGSVVSGWQTVLRGSSVMGPFEERIVLAQGNTPVNGPHQGGWVDTPDGQDWFVHFQSRGLYGRITHLQPMKWCADGWPEMGENRQPVAAHEKPHAPVCERTGEQGSDDFQNELELQWQWMGSWDKRFYEVAGGKLRLNAIVPPEPDGTLWACPQLLSQKVACLAFTAETALDASRLQAGDEAGLLLIGSAYGGLTVKCRQNALVLCCLHGADEVLLSASSIRLRMIFTNTGYSTAEAQFYYNANGAWQPLGKPFAPANHTWVGARVGVYAANMTRDGGYATFDPFIVTPSNIGRG